MTLMFEVPPLSEALLAELGAELGGCDFSHPSQQAFLSQKGPCDVQAAPGNGKTTLLGAKLVLLSRSWQARTQGVCVISHTNAASTEVEGLIANHLVARRMMNYPHFVGTVTSFVHQYIALPYLRGLGWTVRQIDDDVFAAEAMRRYPSYWALTNHAAKAGNQVTEWVSNLNLAPNFSDTATRPASLEVHRRPRQHGADKDCGKALSKLKASMVRDGLYRYADMIALAERALDDTPDLADRLRNRFPLVILDEAQDTHGAQMRLLERIFKHNDTAFQRLGDNNQTLYEDDNPKPEYWSPGATSIPLNTSRRFGSDIAAFASRLTSRTEQIIVAETERASRRVLLLFDQASIEAVLPAFAREAAIHWGQSVRSRDIWAVASRHRSAAHRGIWKPRSLADYHPAYVSDGGAREKSDLMCRRLRRAMVLHAAEGTPAQVAEILAGAVAGVARLYEWQTTHGKPVAAQNVWAALAAHGEQIPRRVRRLLRDHVLLGEAVWEPLAWSAFVKELTDILGAWPEAAKAAMEAHTAFVPGAKPVASNGRAKSNKRANFEGVPLSLGSIHSVKGKSVDGILVVESEVWKGHAATDKCSDLSTVLPRAFGVTAVGFEGIAVAAATNVFVGVTRPRELLGLALPKSTASELIGPAKEQGWLVIDLVAEGDAPQ
ncbi:UvrD-helicase domain-containing protein [Devosia sp. WQ 349]|uniref:UvrD-helicase domain-containing protein n=1 Tax=Devosia sp. WQ 349K1 TaxID=2800329 RepID=UPI001907AFA6|nr:UvrD-helicase domain-containing protein [Devosia sp. WQ 349K1]MBK1795510.1 UvrD-helicase domain-containing protein [Devosia sp. WQ 349K1]